MKKNIAHILLFFVFLSSFSSCSKSAEKDAKEAVKYTKESVAYSKEHNLENAESSFQKTQQIFDKYRDTPDFDKFEELYNKYLIEE